MARFKVMNRANRVNHNVPIQFLEEKNTIFEFHCAAAGEDGFSIKLQHARREKELESSPKVSILLLFELQHAGREKTCFATG